MLNKKHILSLILLLLSVTLTAAAEDAFRMRSCRRGVMPVSLGARRAQSLKPSVGGDFYNGDRHQLTILVSFSDLQFSESDPMTAWNRLFNEKNLSEAPFYGSVHDYFYAQSDGQFHLTFDLLSISLSDPVAKYRSTGEDGDDENSQYLVNDLVDSLLKMDIDWSIYDWNDNGYVNQIIIIYPGRGQNDGGGTNSIWPHQYWLSWHEKDRHKPTYQKGVKCEPRQVTSGGKEYLIDCYCALQEIANDRVYGSFGTICHEYTHCFGFPDFYGTSETPSYWELMDNGNYNGNGFCPPNYSAHERWLMGWLTPLELTASAAVTGMPALSDNPQAYLIRNDGYPDEYYVLENRQQRGWDQCLPGNGIVVFHVDYDETVWLTAFPNQLARKRYYIIPANNKPSHYGSNIKYWPYPYESNDSLTNNSSPAAELYNANSDGTTLMNKSLYDMRVDDGLASFRFVVSKPTAIRELTDRQPHTVLYDLGPVLIIRTANGEIKKVMKH